MNSDFETLMFLCSILIGQTKGFIQECDFNMSWTYNTYGDV